MELWGISSSGGSHAALPPYKYKISQEISSSFPVTLDGVALGPVRAAGSYFSPKKLKSGVAIAVAAFARAHEQPQPRKLRSAPQASEAAQQQQQQQQLTPLPLLDARLPWRRLEGGGGGGGAGALPKVREESISSLLFFCGSSCEVV